MSANRFYNGEFERGVLDFIRSQNKNKVVSPKERVKCFFERYKDVRLLDCPFCGGYPKLKFDLHTYGGNSGMAGAYHISATIICNLCGVRFVNESVFTNVTAPDNEIMSEEKTDESVAELAKKWNRRCDKMG